MPSPNPDTAKYGEALLALAEATGMVPRVEQDLTAVLDFMDRREDMRRFLADPTVLDSGKSGAIVDLFRERVHPTFLHFLQILQAQRQIPNLPAIAEAFFAGASRLRRCAAGELVAATPLSDPMIAIIEHEVGRALGLNVHFTVRVNPDLLGGVKIRVGDIVLDGTVDHYLESVRKHLLS